MAKGPSLNIFFELQKGMGGCAAQYAPTNTKPKITKARIIIDRYIIIKVDYSIFNLNKAIFKKITWHKYKQRENVKLLSLISFHELIDWKRLRLLYDFQFFLGCFLKMKLFEFLGRDFFHLKNFIYVYFAEGWWGLIIIRMFWLEHQ